MKNIWLHRISHHSEISYPLIEKGYLSIGFSELGIDRKILGKITRTDFNELLKAHPENRVTLWNFIHEMKKGDWVLVPGGNWTFSIYRLSEDNAIPVLEIDDHTMQCWWKEPLIRKGGLFYEGKAVVDLGFFRKVDPIAVGISRHKYVDPKTDKSFVSAMGHLRTNLNITEERPVVEKVLLAFFSDHTL